MTVRPIIFSGPMVRALLEGRKTQTRRLLPKSVTVPADADEVFAWFRCLNWVGEQAESGIYARQHIKEDDHEPVNSGYLRHIAPSPYAPGDLLYVREAFCYALPGGYDAREDGGSVWRRASDAGECDGPWRPSIHMPRWASRLTLEVTGVKVERLQDITEEDAIAEGARRFDDIPLDSFHRRNPDNADRWSMKEPPTTGHCLSTARWAFASYWHSLNAKRAPWEANPWVVALTFKVIQQNVDALLAGSEAA